MGELNEKSWAVTSERGCEAAGLTYDDAVRLIRRLKEEKVSGLCVITDEAARRLKSPGESSPEGEASVVGGPARIVR